MEFRNLKLGSKQMIGFGLILVIMAVSNIFSIWTMATLKAEIDEVSMNWLPRAVVISDINLHTTNLRLNQLQYAFITDETQKQQQADILISLLDKINENIDIFEELTKESEERNLYSLDEKKFYREFNEKWEQYQDLSFTFFRLSRDNNTQAAVDVLNGEAQTVFNDITTILANLVEVSQKDAFDAASRAETTYQSARTINIILLIATIILSVVIATLLMRSITVPLNQLVSAVTNVAAGHLDMHLENISKDEIGDLGRSFNQMTIALLEAREKTELETKLRAEAAELKIKTAEAEARALKAENDRKAHELEQARRLQLSMLPEKLPVMSNLDIATYMKTATEVGGDYYDYKLNGNGTLTLAIGDATGHGLHAGTMVAATKSLFNALADQPDPVQTLRKISQALKEMGFAQMYMAMTLAKIQGRQMILSSAGMPYALVYSTVTHDVEKVVLKGMPLGSFPGYPYQRKEINLNKGDTVLFMSDGITEMFSERKETLGEERLMSLFAEAVSKSPGDIIEYLMRAGEEWANGHIQEDDITLVVLKIK